jgi:uncharacterized pyridoxal phosphate-containing UPF0001 family protein
MINKEFGTLQKNNIKAVIDYFSTHHSGKAKDIGVSGSLMSSLCARGYAKVADVAEEFVLVDSYNNLYKKVEVNVYALKVAPSTLAVEYNTSRERMANVEKTKAETLIDCAKKRLTEAERLLQGI